MIEKVKKKTRRSFLLEVLFGWTALIAAPVLYGIVEYLLPHKLKEKLIQNYLLGKITEIPYDGSKMFKVNKKPVIVVQSEQGQVKAFSALCTHLGCVVEFKPEEQKFHCNCHGSIFDKDGKNISGPAPTPLKPFRVAIENDNILITES